LQAQVSVIPYGAPENRTLATQPKITDGKLRVLFVGALTQRKGLSYLLQAVRRFGSEIELTLIGRRVADCPALDMALGAHRWIPSISHAALLEEMSHHDVMVFPSLFEGFGLVILEAMSRGVPVIATPNTAAPDFFSDGEDGFIVPIRDADAIAGKLEILMLDRNRLSEMSRAAMLKAEQHSWEQYRQRLASIVQSALMNQTTMHSATIKPLHPEVCPS
jgi:glycosyltransferase involved in cell wall biosynthesis